MTGLETVLTEIDAVGRDLDRRSFLKALAVPFVVPSGALDGIDDRFFRNVTATLVPEAALRQTGIDPVANLHHLLNRTNVRHRQRIGQLITAMRRIAIFYGGPEIAIRGRQSRFVLVQKASRALASLCLLTVWGDARAFDLVLDPGKLT